MKPFSPRLLSATLLSCSLLAACGGGDGEPAAAAEAAALTCDTSHYVADAVALPTADELKTYVGTYEGDEGSFGPNPGDPFVKSGSATLVFAADGSFSYKGSAYKITSVCIDKVANATGDRFVYLEAGKGLIDVTSKGTAHGSSPADGSTMFQNGVKK
jgi:hypothetical protein